MQLKDFPNGKGDRVIHSPWLWDQLKPFRTGTVNRNTGADWKVKAGVSISRGKWPNLKTVVDGRHYFTPREAAAIFMLGLWNGTLRAIVDPKLRSGQITALQVEDLFDQWMALDNVKVCPRWVSIKAVLQTIGTKQPTYADLVKIVNTKKPIPVTTLKRWMKEAGGKYDRNARCPVEVMAKVCQRV